MAYIKVHKDRSIQTWYWTCTVPLCANQDWQMGHLPTVAAGLAHLRTHQRLGFRR